MGAISVRLPDSLHELVRDVAAQDHVSLNQFIASAVAEKVSALRTERYLSERGQRASLGAFRSALAAVPNRPAEGADAL